MLGGLASVADYTRVVVIFAPGAEAAPLAQRIAAGRHSVFFAHHADYAAATSANATDGAAVGETAAETGGKTAGTTDRMTDPAAGALRAFRSAPHYLLDARLMQAWAEALNQSGDIERARYVAQRLREFRNEQAAPFFAPCQAIPTAGMALPFQCLAPTRRFTYHDFR